MPWKRITKFANQIAGTIATRFPSEEFLKALDVIIPREWATAHDPSFSASDISLYLRLMRRMEAHSRLSSKVQSIGGPISGTSSGEQYPRPVRVLSRRQIRNCEEYD
jgi:hypothetical protein